MGFGIAIPTDYIAYILIIHWRGAGEPRTFSIQHSFEGFSIAISKT
jgi:hypothetical protein